MGLSSGSMEPLSNPMGSRSRLWRVVVKGCYSEPHWTIQLMLCLLCFTGATQILDDAVLRIRPCHGRALR